MVPHLLTLPAEIRNIIYKFALTESAGVNYREDERGFGWLCSFQPELFGDHDSEFDNYGRWLLAKIERAEEQKREGDNLDLTLLSKYDQLRNEAVNKDCVCIGPVHYTFRDLATSTTYTIANQLQFVCNQLRQETRYLSLRYNKIVFSTPDSSSVRLCANFLRTLPLQRMQDLTTLAIKTYQLHFDDELAAVMRFCRFTPSAAVHLHQGRHGEHDTFLSTILQSHKYLRHMPLLDKAEEMEIQRLYFENGVEKRWAKDLKASTPGNFRIRHGYRAFDEESFEQHLVWNPREFVLPDRINCSMDDLFSFVKRLVEVGF